MGHRPRCKFQIQYPGYSIDLATGERLDFSDVRRFSDGLAPVCRRDANERDKYGYIDSTDVVVIQLEYDYADNFCEGLAMVTKEDTDGNRMRGFIDTFGKIVIPLEYNDALIFMMDLRG